MLFETDYLTLIVTLLTGSTVIMIFGWSLYYKIRKKYPVTVNCWFCDTYTKVSVENKNCWDCPYCEQYNGFTIDGDYNKPIPAQYDEYLNKPVIPRKRYIPKNSTNGLCRICNRNQELKMYQLASFSPRNPAKFDEEVESFRRRLENEYKLCSLCESLLEKTLSCQKKWTTSLNMGYALKRGRYQNVNEKYIWNPPWRLKIGSMIKFRYLMLKRWVTGILVAVTQIIFLMKGGAFLPNILLVKVKQFSQWFSQHALWISRTLLVLLSGWIILVHFMQLPGNAPACIVYFISVLPSGHSLAMELTVQWMWFLLGAALFTQVIVAQISLQRNAPFSLAADSICCFLWLGQQIILSACPTATHNCIFILKNPTWDVSLDFGNFLEIVRYLTLFCETVAILALCRSSQKPKCTCGHVRSKTQPKSNKSFASTNSGEDTCKQKDPSSTNTSPKKSSAASENFSESLKAVPSPIFCDDEDELGIGNLSLGPAEVSSSEKTREQAPSCRKPVIHPARLNIKNIVQSSWVAGGYWQIPNTNWFSVPYHPYQMPFQTAFSYNGLPHSRSSSQSSGFFTSGSASSSVCGDHESIFMVSESAYRKHPYYGNIFPSSYPPSSFSYYPGHPGLLSHYW